MPELNIAPDTYTVQSGDSLSKILGTSDPAAIGAFMRANGLTSSMIHSGDQLVLPSSGDYISSDAALGLATLNQDNSRLASLQQSNVFATLDLSAAAPVGVGVQVASNEQVYSGNGYYLGADGLAHPAGLYIGGQPPPGSPIGETRSAVASILSGAGEAEAYNYGNGVHYPANPSLIGTSGAMSPDTSAGEGGASLYGVSDYVGAGLGAYSGGLMVGIQAAGVNVEESAFKLGPVAVKYGLPALLGDAPAGIGAAIGVGEAYQAYSEGNNYEAGEKLFAAGGGIAGGIVGELGAVALFGEVGGLAIAASIAAPVLGTLALTGLAVYGYHRLMQRPPLSSHE